MKHTTNKTDTASLRHKAEEKLKTRAAATPSQLSEADTLSLLHELQVSQIELELQINELTLVKERAELAYEKHTELYDHAPSGYFTLTPDGKIIELNLTGAIMIGIERSIVKNKRFDSFISAETRPVFYLFLTNAFKTKKKNPAMLPWPQKATYHCMFNFQALLPARRNIALLL